MKAITFKQFKTDFEEYYNEKLTVIRSEDEMEVTMSDLYNSESYEFDWDKRIIELY